MKTVMLCLCLLLAACAEGNAPPDRQGPRARPTDPKLSHTWQIDKGVVAKADLGSVPAEMADGLMGQLPSVVHRISQKCAARGKLRGPGALVLRFELTNGGILGAIDGDPAGPQSGCLAEALSGESKALEGAPEGKALLRLELRGGADG